MTTQIIPLNRHPIDMVILLFFLVYLLYITYIVDLEQRVIRDASSFTYPAWPPPAAVDAIHWWGRTYDPVLIARPAWWKVTVAIDAVFSGPFYLIAIYAFVKGKNWIRVPCFLHSSMLLTNVPIILGEERFGMYATPHFPIVLLANLPWLLFPVIITLGMLRPMPFMSAAAVQHTESTSILSTPVNIR